MGPHAGKGSGELSLNRRLEDVFHAGDVFLADALYCNYFLIARLQALFEQNGARNTDFRRGECLGAATISYVGRRAKRDPNGWLGPITKPFPQSSSCGRSASAAACW
jgi:hypothetical protein